MWCVMDSAITQVAGIAGCVAEPDGLVACTLHFGHVARMVAQLIVMTIACTGVCPGGSNCFTSL